MNELDGRTYAGYTTDPARRLRQHNRELSGGARSTASRAGLWSFLFVVACPDFDRRTGLSFEWFLKHVPRAAPASDKRLRGVARRLICLRWTLHRFARLRPRVTVYADEAHIGDVCAYLSDLDMGSGEGEGEGECEEVDVRPLRELRDAQRA